MAVSFGLIQVPPNSNGAIIDTSTMTQTSGPASGQTVNRQNMCIGDSDTPANVATVDANGGLTVAGEAASGAAVTGNPVQVGGSDGTFARALLTDTSGRQAIVGAGAAGAAVVGNPVLVAGSDGTDARSILTDASGNVQVNVTKWNGTTSVTGGVGGSVGVGGLAASGAPVAGNPVLVGGYDGTNATRFSTASATNQAATTGNGSMLMAFPGNWSVTALPAVNAAATVTKAAGGAGVRHVCTGFTFTISGDSNAPTALNLTVAVINGASGATNAYLWVGTIAVPATAGFFNQLNLSGLTLVGSAATAMTIEFQASGGGSATAGGAHTYQAVSMSGYDVS